MFGKKKDPPAPQQPFPLQVLTTEYLIEGMAQANEQFYIPTSDEFWWPFALSDARITSVNHAHLPVRKANLFEVQGKTIVAVIPQRDATTMTRFEVYDAYKKKMKGIYYAGPFLFDGTLMSFNNDRFNATLLMVDVSIRHLDPNSAFKEIKAPHILVSTAWFHGREVQE